ncbi:MAG: amylo-alpha-1,6-glucosidase [Promethearchaeia archaeon]
MSIELDEEDLRLNRAVTFEWLYTNGLGGYASSTVVGLNTRGHHGLLVCSLNPPVDRWLTISRLDDVLATSECEYNLSVEETTEGVTRRGYRHIKSFELNPLPIMRYETDCFEAEKSVFMPFRRNITVVNYEIETKEDTVFTVTPVQTCRELDERPEELTFEPHVDARPENAYFCSDSRENSPSVFAYSPDSQFMEAKIHKSKLQIYRKDKSRGLDHTDVLFTPGVFHSVLEPGSHFLSFLFAAGRSREELVKDLDSLTEAKRRDFARLRFNELKRRRILNSRAYSMSEKKRNKSMEWLIFNADAFIVDRESTQQKSVIAGYHNLADIGHDAMVSLPGLTVAIGRFQDARGILTTYARYSRYGLIANDFPDRGIQPEYDSVDASLWFILGVKKYIDHTHDTEFLRGLIWDTIQSIIGAFRTGTKYGIYEDHDGLICSGIPGVEVSWMNEKVGNWLATPRTGKCVEVNALWFNALMAAGDLCELMGCDPYEYRAVASWIREAFVQTFWDEELGYLYDVVTDDRNDESLRPNQIFALSLPYNLLDTKKAKSILSIVGEELVTPYGLRTLAPSDPRYAPSHTGGPRSRAGSTHQGTVHPWLIGPFISAYLNVHGRDKKTRQIAEKNFFRPVLSSIRDGCLGTISGMFDGSDPHRDRGCVSRARCVAELLRLYFEEL